MKESQQGRLRRHAIEVGEPGAGTHASSAMSMILSSYLD